MADVREFRRNWPQEKDRIRAELPSGRYRFGPLDRVALAKGDEIDLCRGILTPVDSEITIR